MAKATRPLEDPRCSRCGSVMHKAPWMHGWWCLCGQERAVVPPRLVVARG